MESGRKQDKAIAHRHGCGFRPAQYHCPSLCTVHTRQTGPICPSPRHALSAAEEKDKRKQHKQPHQQRNIHLGRRRRGAHQRSNDILVSIVPVGVRLERVRVLVDAAAVCEADWGVEIQLDGVVSMTSVVVEGVKVTGCAVQCSAVESSTLHSTFPTFFLRCIHV